MRVLLTAEEKRERKNADNKAYYEKNKDKLNAKHKTYRENNKDKIRVKYKAYRENNKDKLKAYRENNKDKLNANNKAYRENNKDKIRVKHKAYRENNKDKLKAYSKAYRENNKDYFKAYSKAYKENNRDRMNAKNSERKCRRLFATCKTSIKVRREMIYLIASEISLETGIAHDVDHIIPISKGGINHEEFLMVTTHLYNCQKSAKLDHPLPEMQYLILDDLVQLYLKEV